MDDTIDLNITILTFKLYVSTLILNFTTNNVGHIKYDSVDTL